MPKSVAEKLLVRDDAPLVVLGRQELPDAPGLALPENPASSTPAAADVVLAFVADRAHLDLTLAELLPEVSGVRAVWLAYRKGNVVDINRDTIAAAVTAHAWRPVTQIALDDAWSALRVRPL